jgi:hypothetical protein
MPDAVRECIAGGDGIHPWPMAAGKLREFPEFRRGRGYPYSFVLQGNT